MNAKMLFLLLIIAVVFISGCTQQQSSSCGNSVIDAGEECDGGSCPSDRICTEKCRCESLAPPQLP